VLQRVRSIVPLDSGDVDGIVGHFLLARYQPAVVLGSATLEEVSKLEEHRAMLPGLVIQSEPRRVYPLGKAVAHLVGYVGEVTEADLDANRYRNARLGTLVGRAGLEQEYDDSLRGSPGVRYIEVDARGRLVREEGAAPALLPIQGHSLVTTIDLPLQQFIDSIWPAGVRGSMVAVTPKGEVRALYSMPGYDPNDFIGGISSAEWRALNEDKGVPLYDRAVQARYPPGSPFKLAIAAMALRRGIVDFTTKMPDPCRGGLQYGNRFFRCWKPAGHGYLDLTGAIAQSCDAYFYQLGLRLGLDAITKDGVLLGFKDKSGIDIVNEVSNLFPSSPAYFDRVYGPRNWSNAVVLNLSIGQGENAQTMMNMLKFYQALASGGKAVTPYIVRPRKEDTRDLGLTEAQLEGLRQSLIAVVERGTAAASRHTDLQVAGKTGTAENAHGKPHAWFIAFAPADKPQIVIGGIMENMGHGTFVAPYVVRAIRRYILGPDSAGKAPIRVIVPDETAPGQMDLAPDTGVTSAPDTLPLRPRASP
jgi:penicillin-binding protein 2